MSFDRLDRQQQAAFERVVALLHSAAVPVREPGHQAPDDLTGRSVGYTPFLDTARTGRNVLVSGDRGTGKTTLLLSLASALVSGQGRPGWPSSMGGLPAGDSPERIRTRERIASLRRRLVWLETLDMEPISDKTNLLGAVLARVEDAVGARYPTLDESSPPPSLVYPGRGYHDVQQQLLRLQTSIALTFEGNLTERGGSLDPDTFAVESRRTERERLSLDRRFASVLASLSAVLGGSGELEDPLFVLPVDDLDLNLRSCIPLLKLLRKAYSPHLLVVMAADVSLLTTITRLLYRGDLARIADPIGLSVRDQRQADDLAANALRKHLPPTHQVHLGVLDPAAALDYPPGETDEPKLRSVLGRIGLPPDHARLTAQPEFWGPGLPPEPELVSEPRSWSPAASVRDDVEGYSWAQALRVPMRHVVDLYEACRRGQGETAGLSHGREGDAEAPLRGWARDRLAEWERDEPDEQSEHGPRVSLRTPLSGQSSIPGAGDSAIVTSPRPDWAVHLPSGSLTSAEAQAYIGCRELAVDEYALVPPVVAALRTTHLPSGPTVISWPWVEHSTFWGYERADSWVRRASALWQEREEPEFLFGAWTAVMTAQLFGPAETQPESPDSPVWATGWDSLAQHLDRVPPTPLKDHWLVAVGLLCTPEMGMRDPSPATGLVPAESAIRVQAGRAARTQRLPRPAQQLVSTWPAPPDPNPRSGRTPAKRAAAGRQESGTRRTAKRQGA